MHRLTNPLSKNRFRNGFTLIELLIVVGILLLLLSLTLAVFNTTDESDRIRSSARQLQSSLLGARDRAIKAKGPIGLRLMLDDPGAGTSDYRSRVATSMVYVGGQGYGFASVGTQNYWNQGTVVLGYPDFSVSPIGAPVLPMGHTEMNPNDLLPEYVDGQVILWGLNTDWSLLFAQNLIASDSRVGLKVNDRWEWYTIHTGLLASPPGLNASAQNGIRNCVGIPGATIEFLILQGNGAQSPVPDTSPCPGVDVLTQRVQEYRLELKPTLLPGQEPMRLSSGIVVDLHRSKVPSSWRNDIDSNPNTPDIFTGSSLDIMFSPSGVAYDPSVVAGGPIHLLLRTIDDVANDRGTADPQRGEQLILSIFPQTGLVATFPVDVTDSNNDQWADDPLRFAKIGGTAGR